MRVMYDMVFYTHTHIIYVLVHWVYSVYYMHARMHAHAHTHTIYYISNAPKRK